MPLAVMLVCIAIQSWSISYFLYYDLVPSLWDAFISWFFLGLFIFFITHTFSYYHPSREKLAVIIVLPIILTLIWWSLHRLLINWIIIDPVYLKFIGNHQFYRITVCFLMLMSTTIISLIWYQLMEKEDMQRRREETEKMLKDAELFKLRQQLQPHFLFNSLNSINSLIGSQPKLARNMVQKLSEFLRGTVKREDQKLVKWAEELQYLKNYLDIEQLRFGHRLEIKHEHEEDALEAFIPPLLIQPLLENAIKYGLYGTTESIMIHFNSNVRSNILTIEVQNPYESDQTTESGTGFGLNSVNRRLYLLFGRKDLLRINQEEDIFTAKLTIPQNYDKSTDN